MITSKRIAWQTVVAVMENSKYKDYQDSMSEYRTSLENDMNKDCLSIISQIEEDIIKKKGGSDEVRAFFMKIMADNYRYIVEMSRGERQKLAREAAKSLYEEALKLPLQPCNPTKLGLTLNSSVFYHDHLHDKLTAISVADQSLTAALEKIDDLGEEEFKEAKTVID